MLESTFVDCSARRQLRTLSPMTARRHAVQELIRRDEDDPPRTRQSRRDWIVDGVVVVIAAGLGAVSGLSSAQHGLHGPLLLVDAILGGALCASLWWRRRYPFELALASVPVVVVSSSAGPAGLVLLYTVAAYRRWYPAAVIAALEIVLLPVQRAIHPQGDSTVGFYLTGVVCTAAAVAFGMFRRGRYQASAERRRRAEAEEQLRTEQIRHAERTRIAREMHDVLAHRISLLSLHAGALEFRPDAPPDEVARAAAVIRTSAHRALEDLRAVIGVLREGSDAEAPQPPQPTLANLPTLLEESRAAGMHVHAEVCVENLAAVPEATGRHALRIVQEALTNARKHATSAPVELRIDGAPGQGLAIEVRNPLPALAGAETRIPGAGAGLLGLSERATLSGGRIEHGVDEHGDFRLRAWLPWAE